MIGRFIEKKSLLFLFLIVIFGSFLRLYKVTTIPPGLYIDEIFIAYNANEIFTKGVDQYGQRYPLWFRAFGEYKMPAYIYSTVASIAAFGRTDFAVRAPSIFSGILTLIVFYFLTKRILEMDKTTLPVRPAFFA